MLTENQLAQMRGTAAATMTRTAVHRRPHANSSATATPGPFLDPPPGRVLLGEVPCRYTPASERTDGLIAPIAFRDTAVPVWRVFVPWGTDVRLGDELTVDGMRLDVLAVAVGSQATATKLIAKQVL